MTLAMEPAPCPPALRGWLDAHSRLRRDADAIYTAAVELDPSDRAAAAALAGRFAAVARMLDAHHRFEDDVLFPTAVEHEPGFGGEVVCLSLGHVDIDDVVEDIANSLAVLAGSSTRAVEVWQRLVHNANTFRVLLDEQIGKEETRALPVLVRTFRADVRPSAAA